MPTEMRKIVFSRRELIDAFTSHGRKIKSSPLPGDRVHDIHVYQKFGGGVKVLLDVEDAANGQLKRFNLSNNLISDVLLRYCADQNIPVARNADKYLEVIGDNLALSQKIRGQEAFDGSGGTDDVETIELSGD
jgi:hypothetical protein